MTMLDNGALSAPGPQSGSTDVVVQLQSIVQQLSALVQAFGGRFAFGTFTLNAAATTTIVNTAVKGNSSIQFTPTNASAGTLMGSAKSLRVTSISAGTSFTVGTADGTNPAGTETFSYTIVTPT